MHTPTLAQSLATIEARARDYRARGIPLYEANTIDTLIAPTLRALGWDTEDIDQVRREYRHHPKDNPVDFALLHDGAPVLYVEAKGLHESLDDRRWITQTHAYAYNCGVPWAVLTNGFSWRIYKVAAPGQAEQKLLLEVTLSDLHAAAHLDVLARHNLVPRCKLDTLWRTKEIDQVMKDLFSGMTDNPTILRAFARASEGRLTSDDVAQALKRAKPRADWTTGFDTALTSAASAATSPATAPAVKAAATPFHVAQQPTVQPLAADPKHQNPMQVEQNEAPAGQVAAIGNAPGRQTMESAADSTGHTAPPSKVRMASAAEGASPTQDGVEPTHEGTPTGKRTYRQLPKMGALIEAGLLHPGDRLHLPKHPEAWCTVVDKNTCAYQGRVLTYNAWGIEVTGWTAIQIYMVAHTSDGRLLDDLRKQLMAR